jgi:excisionase family DNA binding protein
MSGTGGGERAEAPAVVLGAGDIEAIAARDAARTSNAVADDGRAPAGRDGRVPAERMLSPQQIAELTGLGYTTIRREIQRGNLPGFKLAGKLRVLESAYERWRTAQPVHSPRRPQARSTPERRGARPSSKPPARGSVAVLEEIERKVAGAG